MGVLKLRAIHLDQRARVPKQDLRRRLHNARLTRTGRTQEQQVSHRAPRRVQAGAEHLVQIHQCLYALFLPHNLRAQRCLEFQRICAALIGIQWKDNVFHGRLLTPRVCEDANRSRPWSNCDSLTCSVDCRSRNCNSNSPATPDDSEIRRIGGNRSANSKFSSRNSPTSFCTTGESESARSTCCPLTCSRSARQLSSTNGCFLETSRTTRSVI